MPSQLENLSFRDPARARDENLSLAGVSEPLLNRLAALIQSSPDSGRATHFLHRLHAEKPDDFEVICTAPNAVRLAVTVFGQSTFLSEAILRDPNLILNPSLGSDFHRVLRADEYEKRLANHLGLSNTGIPPAERLASFRRQEILRILLRDVLGAGSLSDITEEISNLADAVLNVSLRAIRRDLQTHYPETGSAFSVIALGKLGGQELNYSSDIDLMFVYSGDAQKDLFHKISKQLTELLSTYTSDGLCYRIDLRLRPDGRYGEICRSLESAREYYASRARDWELQMLIKARVAAGDPGPGRELLAFVEPLIYSTTLDFEAVEAVSEARQRIHEKLKRSRHAGLNVKLASGGIRDIEFLVQCLQRLHGGREPWVRHGGTLLALFRLRDKSFLSDREYSRLVTAYQFLRHLEHRLQFLDDRQTHTLPVVAEELAALARRMPSSSFRLPTAPSPALSPAEALDRELNEQLNAVRELYDRVIHSQRLGPVSSTRSAEAPPPAPPPCTVRPEFPSTNLARFLESRTPRFMLRLREAPMIRGKERFEHFLEKLTGEPGRLEMLEIDPELTAATLQFFEYSPYFSDQLLRHPALLLEIAEACGERQGRTGFQPPDNLNDLRRYYREQMVRIQSDSIYRAVDVFKTLRRTSDLAEAVIAASYRIALAEAWDQTPPSTSAYTPTNQLMVIALGRLGMREFDVASDADLVFVIPDDHAPHTAFWTSVAERLIHVVSAYTGHGALFTVDTRLRPHGREGDLVQTESVYKTYFASQADAWEGIAYMKARAVAGDTVRGTQFLNELQEIDWRLYGQNGRSRLQLSEMRARLEREQGLRNPLKAGPGGYYDIDFILLYLRLKGAGIFFKSLNTPERIAILEKMGHLDREDAAVLLDTATLYRAIDHGMRVSTGHPDGSLPTSPSSRALLGELAGRWIPETLRQQSPDILFQATLAEVRQRSRALFDRIFG